MVRASGQCALSSVCTGLVSWYLNLLAGCPWCCVKMLGPAYEGAEELGAWPVVGARPWAFVVPRFSLRNPYNRGFGGSYGCCSGVSWLVVGAGVWLGGEIRSGRSGRCAFVCGVHGLTVGLRRDVC